MTLKMLANTEVEAETPARDPKVRTGAPVPNVGAGQQAVAQLVRRVFLLSDHAPRQVLFAGVDEHAGTTAVSLMAARLLAEQGGRTVCLVEASTWHAQSAHKPASVAPVERIDSNLWLVSGGHAIETSAFNAKKEQLIRLRSEYDYVIVDAPPVGRSEDALVLGGMVDGVILVLRAGVTRRLAALRAKQTLEAAGVTVLGAVLEDRTFPIPDAIYRRI